jgi:hypothetical protein
MRAHPVSHHAEVLDPPAQSARLERPFSSKRRARTRGYPAWLMVGIKAVVTIGLLTAAAAWTMERSAKAHLAQLAGDAAKAAPSKASRQR